jgi:hypothetical protein
VSGEWRRTEPAAPHYLTAITLLPDTDSTRVFTHLLEITYWTCAIAQRSSNRGDAFYSERYELGQLQYVLATDFVYSALRCKPSKHKRRANLRIHQRCHSITGTLGAAQCGVRSAARFESRFLHNRLVNSKKKGVLSQYHNCSMRGLVVAHWPQVNFKCNEVYEYTVGPWLTNSIRSRGLVVIQVGRKSRLFFPIRNNGNTYNSFRNSQSTPYLTFS